MNDIKILHRYFPELSNEKLALFEALKEKYIFWNEKINLISRKDIDRVMSHHILHSLAIARFIRFKPESKILDVGTGGGLPGIPLSIFFPDTQFHLVDSIGKKIGVVQDIADSLGLKNIYAEKIRAEDIQGKYDFAVTRAVAPLSELHTWVSGKIAHYHQHSIPNGIIALKGGDLENEIKPFAKRVQVIALSDYFSEEYFATKKIVYLS